MGVLAVFDEQGQWGETHVCDGSISARLAAAGLNWGSALGTPPAGVTAAGVRLFYLQVGEGGHYGVLCEDGEWLAPSDGAGQAASWRESSDAPDGLPSLDAFIENMLVLTGHEDEG